MLKIHNLLIELAYSLLVHGVFVLLLLVILINALLAPNPGAFVNQLLLFLLLQVSNQLLELILRLGEVLLQIALMRLNFSISCCQSIYLRLQFSILIIFFLYQNLHPTNFGLLFNNDIVFALLLFLEIANDILILLNLSYLLLHLLILLFVKFSQMAATLFQNLQFLFLLAMFFFCLQGLLSLGD